MKDRFLAAGALSEGKLGDAQVYVLDAQKAGDTVYALLKEIPLYFTDEYQNARKN